MTTGELLADQVERITLRRLVAEIGHLDVELGSERVGDRLLRKAQHLAEETADNISAITEGLKAFMDDLGQANQANRGIGKAFAEISQRTTETAQAFSEIVAGLNDLGGGTAEIDRAVVAVVDSSSSMAASVDSVDSKVAGNNAAIESVRRLTMEARRDLELIAAGFDDILRRSATVRALGDRSGSCMQSLDEAISGLQG